MAVLWVATAHALDGSVFAGSMVLESTEKALGFMTEGGEVVFIENVGGVPSWTEAIFEVGGEGGVCPAAELLEKFEDGSFVGVAEGFEGGELAQEGGCFRDEALATVSGEFVGGSGVSSGKGVKASDNFVSPGGQKVGR